MIKKGRKMKKNYIAPYSETILMKAVYYICTGSTHERYEIGGNGSPNKQSGDVNTDAGNNGPGISGAKQFDFDSNWEGE